MQVICDQNEVGLKHKDDPTIVGWMHGDEPDNAQTLPGGKGYGPPIEPKRIIEDYRKLVAADPTRPVMLNLGQGVAWDGWYGRGVRTRHAEDYSEYVKGCDIASFDIYPVAHDHKEVAGKLWFVASGVVRMPQGGGEIATNVVMTIVEVDGQPRHVLLHGYLFIHLPSERVVVSTGYGIYQDGGKEISVRSNVDSARFVKEWHEFARTDNYLRGRAFYADGQLIESKRSYRWSDIVLPKEVRQALDLHVENFFTNSKRLRKLGLKGRRGLILAGPPGTGKTLLGKVLANELDGVSFIWILPRHVRNGESFEAAMSVARFVSPSVVFLEDLDLFGEDREAQGGGVLLGELMNQLDGVAENEDILTIATTNRLEMIEKALRNRPGRFDRVLKLDGLDETCRRMMLTRLLANADISPDDMDHLVQATRDCTGAQIEELANTVYLLAVQQDNGDAVIGGGMANDDSVRVTRSLLDAAMKGLLGERKAPMGFLGAASR
jgi:hypothetical protein